MTIQSGRVTAASDSAARIWRLDPERSSVEFHVRHFYGLTIDADSLDTDNKKRDAHLRSADFVHVDEHPSVRFLSDSAARDGDALTARGQLHAAGDQIPLDVDASVRRVDGELEFAAEALADHRPLGMTWSPLGILRAPSKLIVRGRLVRGEAER
jgi:polyisoprenoid-binding protein YceI